MSSSAEVAVRTYVAVWNEPDPAARAQMLEACFAIDGRLVTSGDGIRGRAALAAAVDEFVTDPRCWLVVSIGRRCCAVCSAPP